MSDILGQFREDALPPSRVDIEQAVRSGRRARRLRTAVTVGGVVIALAIASGTAPLWLSALRGVQTPSGGDTCATQPPLQDSPPTTEWEYFDPQRLEVDTSAVPGYQVLQYLSGRYYQLVVLTTPARDGTVSVLLHAAGTEPQLDGGPYDPASGAATDPVGDAPAFLLPGNTDVGAGIAWQAAPGAWVFVGALLDGAPEGEVAQPQSVAREVAQALRFGTGIPVTAPLSLPTPGCTLLQSIDVRYDPDLGEPLTGEPGTPVLVGLSFVTQVDADQRSAPPYQETYGPRIGVTVERVDPTGPTEGESPQVIDRPGVGQSLSAQVGGLRVSVGVLEARNWQQGPLAGEEPPVLASATEVFESIRFYPDAGATTAGWGPPISP